MASPLASRVRADALVKAASDALWSAWTEYKQVRDYEAEIERLTVLAQEHRDQRDAQLVVLERLGVLPETALDEWSGDRLRSRGAAHQVFVTEGLASVPHQGADE